MMRLNKLVTLMLILIIDHILSYKTDNSHLDKEIQLRFMVIFLSQNYRHKI
jgi:hypothetical protein